MKRTYKQPVIEIIDLNGEKSVMLHTSNTKVDTSSDDFNQRSNEKKMDLWGNDNAWN